MSGRAAKCMYGVIVIGTGLPRMEAFAGEIVGAALAGAGVEVRIGVTVTGVRRPGGAGPVTLALEDGGEVEADEVLFATGRQPLTDAIGLETVGLVPGYWLEVGDTCMVRALADGWLYVLGQAERPARRSRHAAERGSAQAGRRRCVAAHRSTRRVRPRQAHPGKTIIRIAEDRGAPS